MSSARLVTLTLLAMFAFASNSLLCRLALKNTSIDAASFTTIRLLSGALILWLIVHMRRDTPAGSGNWGSALALFFYAAGFSMAYVSLPAATGALLLFGAVQATMIGFGVRAGERLQGMRLLGFTLAVGGLCGLLLPGVSAPPLMGSMLMLGAGVAWAIYSLRGKGGGDPVRVTAGNFLRAAPIAVLSSVVIEGGVDVDGPGFLYALASGGLASGIGYAIWYTAMPALKTTNAATVQLSVPMIAALGGVVFLGEAPTLRLILASAAILGGIALVILDKKSISVGARDAPASAPNATTASRHPSATVAPLIHFNLEFHASEIRSIEAAGDELTVYFSAASVQRTDGASITGNVTGYLNALEMRFGTATWDGPLADCMGRLTDGKLVAAGVPQARPALPCTHTNGVTVELQFANGVQLFITAASLACRFTGEPRFVEDFRC